MHIVETTLQQFSTVTKTSKYSVGGLNTRKASSRWRTIAILKNRTLAISPQMFDQLPRDLTQWRTLKTSKSRYLSNDSIFRREIWFSDRHLSYLPYRRLNFQISKIQDADSHHLKIVKSQYLSNGLAAWWRDDDIGSMNFTMSAPYTTVTILRN